MEKLRLREGEELAKTTEVGKQWTLTCEDKYSSPLLAIPTRSLQAGVTKGSSLLLALGCIPTSDWFPPSRSPLYK